MNIQNLYETDFNSWIQENITLLKQSRFNEIDSENLIEELEGLIRRDKRELESNLLILLAYLLKWQYQEVYRCNEWLCKIIEQRMLIELLLEDMPSLKNYLPTAIENIYSRAAELATVESGTNSFPSICPYTEEQLLDTNFYP
jgi:Domain of unknown function DUF29